MMPDIWAAPSPQGRRGELKLRREQAYAEALALGYDGEDLSSFVVQKLMDYEKLHYEKQPVKSTALWPLACVADPPLPTISSDVVSSPLGSGGADVLPSASVTVAAATASLSAPVAAATASTPPAARRKRSIGIGPNTNGFKRRAKRKRSQPSEDSDELVSKWQLEEELDYLDMHVAMDLGLNEDGVTEEDAALAKEFWEDFDTGAAEDVQSTFYTWERFWEDDDSSELAHAEPTSDGPRQVEAHLSVQASCSSATEDNEALRAENAKLKAELDAAKKKLATLQVDHFTLIEEMNAVEVDVATKQEVIGDETQLGTSLRDDLELSQQTVGVFRSALTGAVRLMARAQQARLLRAFSLGVKKMHAHVGEDLKGIVDEIADLPDKQAQQVEASPLSSVN